MNYQEALKHALNGDAVIFTGAGFSANTVSLDGYPPPQGIELAHILCAQACIKLVDDLKDAADVAIKRLTADRIVPMLGELYRLKSITPHHESIAKIPWIRTYTTNYDDAFEIAHSQIGKTHTTVTPSSPTKQPKKANIILHINGFINTLDTQTLYSEFKLTNQSYQTIEFLESDWSEVLVSDLQQASACFFVGYSLYDIDIQRILRKINRIQEKCFFVFNEYPDDVLESRVKEFGEIITGGYARFAQDLEEANKSFVSSKVPFQFSCFTLETKEKYLVNKKDRPDVFDLLIFGKLNKNKIFSSIANNFDNEYCIIRNYFYLIKKELKKGVRNILIDSDLGNGKTILVEILKAYYTLNNIKCYTLNKELDSIAREFSEIYTNTEKQIVFIEGINRFKNSIHKNQFQRPQNTIFIFTDRTALAEINIRLIKNICEDDLFSLSINKIVDEDLKLLIQLFRTNGLLGKFAGFSDDRCFTEFKNEGLNNFLNIILYLYDNSDHIKSKIEDIIFNIQQKKGYSSLLAAIFIFSFLNTELTLNEILEIIGMTGNKSIIFQTDSSVKQLIDSDYNTISAKSSILAQYILTNKMLSEDIVSMLIKIYDYCAKNKFNNKMYDDIVAELNRFSTLQRILSKENTLEECISYFEAIKKINRNDNNPSFWLQYAIAHTVNDSYERASEYFKTAKSKLGKDQLGVKLYVDNYFARFLLQRSIYDHNYYNFDEFKQVKIIVDEQLTSQETLYYPYRIIMNYRPYYTKFKSNMTKEEKNFILIHCEHIIRTSRLPFSFDRSYYRVKQALEELSLLVNELNLFQ